MGFYVLMVALISGWLGWEPPGQGPIVYILALLPPLGVGGCIWAVGAYIEEEPDEFERMLMARIVIGAVGVTLFVCTAWGFLGWYAHVWTLPLYLVFPLFWAAYALVQPFVRRAFR
jgi:hypothetical protein